MGTVDATTRLGESLQDSPLVWTLILVGFVLIVWAYHRITTGFFNMDLGDPANNATLCDDGAGNCDGSSSDRRDTF